MRQIKTMLWKKCARFFLHIIYRYGLFICVVSAFFSTHRFWIRCVFLGYARCFMRTCKSMHAIKHYMWWFIFGSSTTFYIDDSVGKQKCWIILSKFICGKIVYTIIIRKYWNCLCVFLFNSIARHFSLVQTKTKINKQFIISRDHFSRNFILINELLEKFDLFLWALSLFI